jgi:hypothetical protein
MMNVGELRNGGVDSADSIHAGLKIAKQKIITEVCAYGPPRLEDR